MSAILDVSEIRTILPYSYPMLMVDAFVRESDSRFVGMKCLSFNEELFQGHFPSLPIFPGVLQVEAMKQVAELGIGPKLNPANDRVIYIKALQQVKFRRPNNPGDRMVIETDLRELRDGEADFTATTRNNSGMTCQAKMTLAVRDKRASLRDSILPFNDFDKNEKIQRDIIKIRDIIPHRYPFLLVDYIVSVNGAHVVAVKNVTFNEPAIHSYNSEDPHLPGSVQAEIIAQAGCVSMLTRPENHGKLAYFLSIEEATYMHPARPGDQLIIEVNIPEGHSRFGRGEGFLRVGDKKLCQVSMKFALVDPPSASEENKA